MLNNLTQDFAAQLASGTLIVIGLMLCLWLLSRGRAYPQALCIKALSMINAARRASISWRGAIEKARQ